MSHVYPLQLLFGCCWMTLYLSAARAEDQRPAFPKVPTSVEKRLQVHLPTLQDRILYRFSTNGGISEDDAVMIADLYDVFAAGKASRSLLHTRYPGADLHFERTYRKGRRYFDVWRVSPQGQVPFDFFIDSTYFPTDA